MTDTPDLAIDPAAEHDAEAAGCETHSHHGYMKEKDRYKARLKPSACSTTTCATASPTQ